MTAAAAYHGLDDVARADLRASFAEQVVRGERMPLVVPYSLLGAFIVPTLYLSVSQRRHPWLYTCRWLVAAVITAFNVHVARRTSSGNIAISYATGLLCGWGIIYNLNLLIWTRPQETAARIVRRTTSSNGTWRKRKRRELSPSLAPALDAGSRSVNVDQRADLRQRGNLEARAKEDLPWHGLPPGDGDGDGNDAAATAVHCGGGRLDDGEKSAEAEFVWQPFPHDAPWKERINWACDLTTSFRGCGWNWAISSIPQPKPPAHVQDETPVDMASWPVETPAGYARCTSRADFLRTRLRTVFVMYMLIDFLAITMAQDPYFVLGPNQHPFNTPPHLAWLPSLLLLWLRQLMSLTAFVAAIVGMMTAHALLQHRLAPYIFPTRDQLWHYPSIFGSFSAVLDRGLAGWWGQWWHQTFRAQFLAPATYLLREGYTHKGEAMSAVLTLCISFGQSGMLHGFGSATSIPETRVWRAPAFFMLQAVGLVVEHALATLLPPGIFGAAQKSDVQDGTSSSPRRQGITRRRICNLVFAVMWVQWTSIFFCDDIASTGLWLCDPIPFSPLRMLGFGQPGDRWWRWERQHFPAWYTGAHWWESGLAF